MTFEIINEYILKYFYYIFVGLILAYLVLGRKGKDITKRIPLFLAALLFFAVLISVILTRQYHLPAYLPTAFFFLLFGTSYTMFRQRFFPYRFRCVKCDCKLTGKDIILDEGYLCSGCKGESETGPAPPEAEASGGGDDSQE